MFQALFNISKAISRPPSEDEVSKGVPEWFVVITTDKTKEYRSMEGRNFKSIAAVIEWRTFGPFEEMDCDIPSF